jgi:hypothetical protein
MNSEQRRGVVWVAFKGEGQQGDELQGYAFAYAPQRGRFTAVEQPPAALGIIVCWASDLLALVRGAVEARTVTRHFSESWPRKPAPGLRMPLLQWVLWPFLHPLRGVDACVRQYRLLIARAPAEVA